MSSSRGWSRSNGSEQSEKQAQNAPARSCLRPDATPTTYKLAGADTDVSQTSEREYDTWLYLLKNKGTVPKPCAGSKAQKDDKTRLEEQQTTIDDLRKPGGPTGVWKRAAETGDWAAAGGERAAEEGTLRRHWLRGAVGAMGASADGQRAQGQGHSHPPAPSAGDAHSGDPSGRPARPGASWGHPAGAAGAAGWGEAVIAHAPKGRLRSPSHSSEHAEGSTFTAKQPLATVRFTTSQRRPLAIIYKGRQLFLKNVVPFWTFLMRLFWSTSEKGYRRFCRTLCYQNFYQQVNLLLAKSHFESKTISYTDTVNYVCCVCVRVSCSICWSALSLLTLWLCSFSRLSTAQV